MEENVTTPSPSTTPAEGKRRFKVNKTVLLVIGLIILTAALLYISLSMRGGSPFPSITKNQDTDFAHTTLSVSEEPRVNPQTGQYEVDLLIDSSDNKITGTQLELLYDPNILTNVDIKQGDFMQDPVVILKNIDEETGRVSYVLGTAAGQDAKQGTGVVATLVFNKSVPDETAIEFLPQTLVTGQGYDQSVLSGTTTGIIGALTGGGTQTASPSSTAQ